MNEQLRRSAAHVFVGNVDAPVLDADDVHHLSRVLRLRDGETVTVSDGRGSWRVCTWSDGTARPAGAVHTEPAPSPRLAVALVPVKGDRTDDAVERLVETGIDEGIVRGPTDHSVVRRDPGRAAAGVERLARVARAAAMQSRRVWLAEVTGPVALDVVLARDGAALAEPGGDPSLDGVTTLVVGPEGGFSARETALARRCVGLGAGILRAGTAATVAGTLMVAHRRR
ncbi:MAG: RsmE family RNA methyltransferase [Ilumatobacteraceae bacterium]